MQTRRLHPSTWAHPKTRRQGMSQKKYWALSLSLKQAAEESWWKNYSPWRIRPCFGWCSMVLRNRGRMKIPYDAMGSTQEKTYSLYEQEKHTTNWNCSFLLYQHTVLKSDESFCYEVHICFSCCTLCTKLHPFQQCQNNQSSINHIDS